MGVQVIPIPIEVVCYSSLPNSVFYSHSHGFPWDSQSHWELGIPFPCTFCTEPVTDYILCGRPTARWPLRHAALPDNYRLSQNESFPLMNCMWLAICVQISTMDHWSIIVVLVWRKSIHIGQSYARKTIFTFLFTLALTFVKVKVKVKALISS